jgi:uncharacterized repeat protein (TIGR01451 family)
VIKPAPVNFPLERNQMKKLAAICVLLLLSVVLFVLPIVTRRGQAAIAAADLSVTKVDTPDPVNTGSNLTYTITVTNNGPDVAGNASWTDTLPAGTSFVDLSAPEGWLCTAPETGDGGTVSCSSSSLAMGSSVFTLTVAVAPNVPAGSILSNTATATSNTPDPNSNNNSGTATTTVLSPANVTGSKSRSGGSTPGSTLTYLIILSNSSGSDQQDNPGNEFTDVLSSDLTLVAASASSGTATANTGTNTVTWNGIVPAGDTVSITIDATIKAGTEEHTITNQGSISYDADGNGTNESSRVTNTDSFGVGVGTGNADIGVTKLANADEVLANTNVTYTITVFNGGPDAALNASLNDPLPGNLTFVSLSSPGGWSCTTPAVGAGGTVSCTNPSLPVTTGQTFTLVAHVPTGTQPGTDYPNEATVSTTSLDANSENNESTATTTAVSCFSSVVVTTNADSGPGSLRQAIVDVCAGGTIAFDMNQVVSPISLATGQITIDKNLTIQGPGANLLTVRNTAAASTTSRVFNVNTNVNATISALTISGGNVTSGSGGGILYGTNSTVTVTDSTITGNSATGGAGISNSSGGTLTVINSTISGNTAGNLGGGGIFSGSGTLNVINSTISGNSASDGGGGGISNGGTGNLTNATIANNPASGGAGGGGIRNSGTLNSRNSIIALNTAATGAPDFSGTLTSQGHNLIGNTSGTTGTIVTDIINVNPLLATLANYGGPTQTRALLPGSPALDGGDNCVVSDTCTPALGFPLTTDQRGSGFARAVGTVDIGAFESRGFTITATSGTPQSATITTAFGAPLVVTVSSSFGEPVVGGVVTFTAPASGPSGTFPGASLTASATINGSGVATSPTFTANSTAGGPYNVVASIGTGQPTALFALTNNKAATTTTVTSSANPSNVNQSVTFTATVISTAGTPTGTVQFKDNGTNLGSPVVLNGSGVATFTTSTLAAGVHSISAVYSGDANFLTSTGTLAVSQQVGSVVSFSSNTYNTTEGSGFTTITVVRSGDLSQAVSVDYATPDDSSAMTILPCSTANGVASSRCDFETALGTLRWAAGDGASKTFTVLINQDSFVEGPETLTLTLSNLTGGAGFTQPGATSQTATLTITDDVTEPPTNPIDDTDTFVRQQYRDFLNREPDAAGLAFWKDNIDKCNDPARIPPGLTVPQCIALFRIQTSAAFFLSIEFQNTGYYVERTYKAGFGDIAPPTVPVPVRFTDFLGDTELIGAGVIVGQGNWQAQIDNNKSAYALTFVQRQAFLTRYPAGTTATAFVDSLNANAGNVLSDSQRSALIAELSPNPSDPTLRASVLRKVTDNATLQQREFNRAFVLIEYFGYLRRNPDAAPDMNFNGYNFWLNKLNGFNGNFEIAEMVKAFLTSAEYRQRFGP